MKEMSEQLKEMRTQNAKKNTKRTKRTNDNKIERKKTQVGFTEVKTPIKSLDLFLCLGKKSDAPGISNLSSRCYLSVNLVQIYSCLPLRKKVQSSFHRYFNHIDGKEVVIEFESLFKQISLIMDDIDSNEILNIDHLCNTIKVFNVI